MCQVHGTVVQARWRAWPSTLVAASSNIQVRRLPQPVIQCVHNCDANPLVCFNDFLTAHAPAVVSGQCERGACIMCLPLPRQCRMQHDATSKDEEGQETHVCPMASAVSFPSANIATGELLSTGFAASSSTTFLWVKPGHMMLAPDRTNLMAPAAHGSVSVAGTPLHTR